MEDFSGFEFQMPEQQNIPKKEKEEITVQDKLNISLEEIAIKEKEKKQSGNELTADDFKQPKRGKKEKRYVRLMVPRHELAELCSSMGIKTAGYRVHLEAVITK